MLLITIKKLVQVQSSLHNNLIFCVQKYLGLSSILVYFYFFLFGIIIKVCGSHDIIYAMIAGLDNNLSDPGSNNIGNGDSDGELFVSAVMHFPESAMERVGTCYLVLYIKMK